MPGTSWATTFGSPVLLGGALVSDDGQLAYASASYAIPIGYAGARLRFKFRLGHLSNWIIVYYDSEPGISSTGVGFRIGAVPNQVDIQEGSIHGSTTTSGLGAAIDYYAELEVVGRDAEATIATGDYATSGGSIVESISIADLDEDQLTESSVMVSLDPNGRAPSSGEHPRVYELTLDGVEPCLTGSALRFQVSQKARQRVLCED